MNAVSSKRRPCSFVASTSVASTIAQCVAALCLVAVFGGFATAQPADGERLAYVVEVPLPLVGDRDEAVRRQVNQIAAAASKATERPIVVLAFRATANTEAKPARDDSKAGVGLQSRGSEFGRCLELARVLTDASAARVRLIAYLPNSVEGHSVLPVLACEEIISASSAELGRAAIDDANVGDGIKGFYRDIVSRRRTLPVPVVMSMLGSDAEVYKVKTVDKEATYVDQVELAELRKAGSVVSEETVWPGGSLASYSGQAMRSQGWIARTVDDISELNAAIGVSGPIRPARKFLDKWEPVQLTISGKLTSSRVNQIIRSIGEHLRDERVNMLVLRMETSEASFQEVARLSSYIADLNSEKLFTVGLIQNALQGPATLVPLACDESVYDRRRFDRTARTR